MNISEKIAYLKGLCEGMELNTEKKEGKIIKGLLEILDDVALSVMDVNDNVSALSNEINEIYEEIDSIEYKISDLDLVGYDATDDVDDDADDDDMSNFEYCTDENCDHNHIDNTIEFDNGESINIIDSEEHFNENSDLYQVICPTCGEDIYIDEATLKLGSIKCPACSEDLEFDLSNVENIDNIAPPADDVLADE